ncbi:MAG: DUF4143 domain-containing protein, partial [Treponema maltophilum]
MLFTRFIKLCAGRIGQLVNISSLANDCGISPTTATGWLSLLETSFIVYKLKPDFRNFTKRLIKSPKIGRRLPEVLAVGEIDRILAT